MRSGLFSTEGLAKDPPCGFKKITEGTAAVLFPPARVKNGASGRNRNSDANNTLGDDNGDGHSRCHLEDDAQAVFYNPAQVVNRDLSVCALACFARLRCDEPRRQGGTRAGITILEALSATGLRAIRYYKEIPNVRFIIANDLDAGAVECIRRNCEFNGVPCAEPTLTENFPVSCIQLDEATGTVESGGAVIPNLDDANDLMFRLATNPTVYAGQRLCVVAPNKGGNMTHNPTMTGANMIEDEIRPLLQQELMDAVDLDPYGSASPFLDAAMRCIKEGGLLLLTSTDSAILCGHYPETCHARYNTVPHKNSACHEMAVRILLAAVERVANKHNKYIVPLLSLHIDFYVRCFIRVYTQPAEVKLSPCKLGYVLQCNHCPSYWVRPLAVATARTKKTVKRGRNTSGHGVIESNDNKDIEGGNETEENATHCRADALGRACFQRPPSRHKNFKIRSLNMQELTSFLPTCSCPVCGACVSISGPIYAAPTHSVPFLRQLLQEVEKREAAKQITAAARIAGLVRVALEELPDTPLFYKLDEVASCVKARCPPAANFVAALKRLGYRCSQVHCAPSGIKTDCPSDVLVSVMLQWKQEADVPSEDVAGSSGGAVKTSAASVVSAPTTDAVAAEGRVGRGRAVLVTPLAEADFSYERQFDLRSAVTGVSNFIQNAPNWGPKRRHQGVMRRATGDEH